MAPRTVHYAFAHRILRDLALDDRVDLVSEAIAVDLGPKLSTLWDDANAAVPASDRIDDAGLATYVVQRPDYAGVLVTLPEPIEAAEAHAVMVVRGDASATGSYFTWEHGVDSVSGAPVVYLCGWDRDGNHVNHGTREDASIDGFVSEVGRSLAEA
ncbi:MAG: hypothetical protein HY829_05790 [Actinobacteria bacterium]|nr:hypothetical protein [Actinomycetota bacterium]